MGALLRKACHEPQALQALREQVGRVAEGLFDFQSIVVEGLPCSGPHDMLKELEEEIDGILHVAPVLAKSIQVLLRSLETAARLLPAEEMVLSHGAFRYNQFLSRGDMLLLLDFDTLCLSGASADAGEFLAYLDLTALRRPHLRAVVPDCQEVFLSSLLKHQCVDPRWIAWYRAASHLKWAQRTFFSLDPRWPVLTDSLVQVADQSLGGIT